MGFAPQTATAIHHTDVTERNTENLRQ
jgi:hypothetical protein